jgi:hypothetical protein
MTSLGGRGRPWHPYISEGDGCRTDIECFFNRQPSRARVARIYQYVHGFRHDGGSLIRQTLLSASMA